MGSAAAGVAAVGSSRLGVILEIAHSFATAPAC